MEKYITIVQSYIIAISLFFAALIFIPSFENTYTLPKLLILYFGGFMVIFLESIKIITSRTINIHKSDLYIFLFGAVSFLAWIFSQNKALSFWGEYSREGLGLFSLYAYLAFAIVYTRFTEYYRRLVKVFFVAGTITAAFFALREYASIQMRPVGLEGQPIQSAHSIALGLLVGLDLLMHTSFQKDMKAALAMLLGAFSLFSIYILESSTVLLSLSGAGVVAITTQFKHIQVFLTPARVTIMIAVVVGILFIFSILIPKKSFSTTQRLTELQSSGEMLRHESLSSLKVFLIGHGQNAASIGFRAYKNISTYQTPEWQWQLSNIRNHYLEIFYTTGILGFISWLVIITLASMKAYIQRNSTSFLLLLFIFFWQAVYYLFPLSILITLLYSVELLGKKTSLNLKPVIASLISIPLMILGVYGLIQSMNMVRAEIAYSNKEYEKAITLMPSNYYYPAEYAHTIFNQINTFRFYEKTCVQNRSCSHKYLNEAYERGVRYLKKSLQINPYESDYWNALSSYYFIQYYDNGSTQKKLLRDSEIAAVTGLHIDPYNPLLLDSLGAVFLERGELDKAEEYFRKALKSKPDFTVSQNHLQEVLKHK